MTIQNIMRLLIIFVGSVILLAAVVGCTTPRIYIDEQKTCSWTEVEELIICKGETKKGPLGGPLF